MSEQPAPDEQPRPTTLKMVAARAGVSVTTASRVLNKQTFAISLATQKRVEDAATSLSYRPNTLAASLRKGTTKMIGLIVPDISDTYFHLFARGVEDAAESEGYAVILCNSDRLPAKEVRYVQLLQAHRVDAFIFAGGGLDGERHLLDLPWAGSNVVTVGPHELRFPNIAMNNRAAISAATSHLIDQGCTSIACLSGMPNYLVTEERLAGFREAMEAHGVKLDDRLVFPGDFTFEAGQESMREALAKGLEFDGLVSFNDNSAIGAIQVLKASGRRVPVDIAVVGCDDVPAAGFIDPPLSTVSWSAYELGGQAMRLVMRRAAGQPVPDQQQAGFELKIRESSVRRRSDAAG